MIRLRPLPPTFRVRARISTGKTSNIPPGKRTPPHAISVTYFHKDFFFPSPISASLFNGGAAYFVSPYLIVLLQVG